MPIADCRSSLVEKVKSLKNIKHQRYRGEREARSVGQALNVSITLGGQLATPTRLIFFCGGVCTTGIGKVIDQNFKAEIRMIKEEFPKQSREARQFYRKLGGLARRNSLAIDSFIFSVEEAGLTEMLPCLKATGGLLVQHE